MPKYGSQQLCTQDSSEDDLVWVETCSEDDENVVMMCLQHYYRDVFDSCQQTSHDYARQTQRLPPVGPQLYGLR